MKKVDAFLLTSTSLSTLFAGRAGLRIPAELIVEEAQATVRPPESNTPGKMRQNAPPQQEDQFEKSPLPVPLSCLLMIQLIGEIAIENYDVNEGDMAFHAMYNDKGHLDVVFVSTRAEDCHDPMDDVTFYQSMSSLLRDLNIEAPDSGEVQFAPESLYMMSVSKKALFDVIQHYIDNGYNGIDEPDAHKIYTKGERSKYLQQPLSRVRMYNLAEFAREYLGETLDDPSLSDPQIERHIRALRGMESKSYISKTHYQAALCLSDSYTLSMPLSHIQGVIAAEEAVPGRAPRNMPGYH